MAVLPRWCDRAVVFELPMTVKFRGITRRPGMLLHGEAGWAEWSPFLDYDAAEAATWLAAAREACTEEPPELRRESIPVNVTIPAVGPDAAYARAAASGCRTAKVKVAQAGETLDDDVARAAAVRAALGPEASVRVDANGGWSVPQALEALRELAQFRLEYAEQPTASVEELAELRRALAAEDIPVPIAADESIRRASDPGRVKALAAADVAVLKCQPLGGIRAALRVAEDLGLPAVISSALESSVGLRYGTLLAAALEELPYACGLDTGTLLATDVVAEPLRAVDGALPVVGPPAPDERTDWLADDATTAFWFERLAAANAILEAR